MYCYSKFLCFPGIARCNKRGIYFNNGCFEVSEFYVHRSRETTTCRNCYRTGWFRSDFWGMLYACRHTIIFLGDSNMTSFIWYINNAVISVILSFALAYFQTHFSHHSQVIYGLYRSIIHVLVVSLHINFSRKI